MSSEPLNAPPARENTPDGPEHGHEPADRQEKPGADAETTGGTAGHEQRIAALRKRVAELETELHRERLGRVHQLPNNVAARINGDTAEEREADARTLAGLFRSRTLPRGRGGLDPNERDRSRATWPEAFRRARENQQTGGSGVTYLSNSR
ncbi:hypothetical protein ACFC09_14400 [Streptomyces sp. NPDC056161]|uniref:hypothetical protein n=1 Tax=Streptomyces sp. NPDC056161 TaxID=3345732 RepID=UPI0035D85027